MSEELKVIQKAYDFCLYLMPIVNRFRRDFKFTLGDQITNDNMFHGRSPFWASSPFLNWEPSYRGHPVRGPAFSSHLR